MNGITETPDWSAIPAPEDDGSTRHLGGVVLPSLALPATDGELVDLSALRGRIVVYAYPRTGQPGVPNPEGWDLIPGARGCTPQSCGFRDHHFELQKLGVDYLFGLSTQTIEYQREAAERLHLPFAILSDGKLALTKLLNLPTFEADGLTLLKRFTLVIEDGRIEHVFYPVFPPDQSAEEVTRWLMAQRR